ncbi:unnamed protein product [Trypanosoma congolense IL3000]|uniref:WGS project CAEQ00000000 data, annotated contig 1324 n=1 Tax=Trypanosoma congolense (strain IL3000) TaxID=1068625 RepID=F9W5G1_TRYCI|nr:unnamed protein product [Trypanosoma congolense IL3000]
MEELQRLAASCKAELVGRTQHWMAKLDGAFSNGATMSLQALRSAGVALFTFCLASVAAFVVLSACVAASVFGSLLLRQYILLLVPGNELTTLDFNTMPLETERWRLHDLSQMIAQFDVTPSDSLHGASTILTNRGAERDERHTSALRTEGDTLKMSLISKMVYGTVATSTLILPSPVRGDVFHADGSVSTEALFSQRKPMFHAKGVYNAKMQLVFHKEDVGRDISLVLESVVLMANESYVPQPLKSLRELLRVTSSFTITTGRRFGSWPRELLAESLHAAFCFPIWIFQTLSDVLHSDVFPVIDRATEVAVVTSVYTNFEPPLHLQPRLRAINFTLYHSEGDTSSKPRLKRALFHTSVELKGLAYYFSTYTISSFIGVTIFLLTLLGTGALTFAVAAGLFVVLPRLRHTAKCGGQKPLGRVSPAASHDGRVMAPKEEVDSA